MDEKLIISNVFRPRTQNYDWHHHIF